MTVYSTIRPLVFALPPETAHSLGKRTLRLAQSTRPTRAAIQRLYEYHHPSLEVELFDATFPSPVGVAAGFDKNAEVTHALAALGFGFVEIGTVTPRPQTGNPKPRLFRLPEDEAMINRLGFPGHGADRVRARLEADGRPSIPLGINLGKMNDADEEEAIEDYRRVFDRLADYADYVVVNVSCPNTPDEFDEQDPKHLRAIFSVLQEENDADVPLLVKIGPDTTPESARELVDIVEEHDLDGIVATNTTEQRDGVTSAKADEWGGLSGAPIEERSTALVRTLYAYTDLPIVGVGGVRDADTAYRKIRAGASLVQLYTGFVYGGPSTAKRINRGLVERLERDGFGSVSEAVGADVDE